MNMPPKSSHTLPFTSQIEEPVDLNLQMEVDGGTESSDQLVQTPPLIDMTEIRAEASHNPHGFLYRVSKPFRRVIGAIKEWSDLQRKIRVISTSMEKNEWDVLESINNYRMLLSSVSFKPTKLDKDIWEGYQYLRSKIPVQKKETAKRPLLFRRRRTLRVLHGEWVELQTRQSALLDTLVKAPKSVEFFNRINFARIKKREEEIREAEIARRNAEAKESIEKSLAQLGTLFTPGNQFSLGSSILKLEDAQSFWTTRLAEISNLETARSMDADELISIYQSMEGALQDAPRMAEQVREVEVQFMRMVTMNEELATFGKYIIPADELARMLTVVQNEIPNLWASRKLGKTALVAQRSRRLYQILRDPPSVQSCPWPKGASPAWLGPSWPGPHPCQSVRSHRSCGDLFPQSTRATGLCAGILMPSHGLRSRSRRK